MYRMKTDDFFPFTKGLAYTPIYVYLKKDEDNNLVEAHTLKTGPDQSLVNKLSDLSGLDFRTKVRLDYMFQLTSWYWNNDVYDDFDFDYDASEAFAKKR